MLEEYTKGKKLNEPLFTTKFKNRLERVAAYKIINATCEEAGLEERVGTHTLRKTFGYHHYQKYKDIAILQKILNHSSPNITMRYIGVEQDTIDYSYLHFAL
jgi:integrase